MQLHVNFGLPQIVSTLSFFLFRFFVCFLFVCLFVYSHLFPVVRLRVRLGNRTLAVVGGALAIAEEKQEQETHTHTHTRARTCAGVRPYSGISSSSSSSSPSFFFFFLAYYNS